METGKSIPQILLVEIMNSSVVTFLYGLKEFHGAQSIMSLLLEQAPKHVWSH